MLSTISFIFFGVGEVNFITAKETIKFNIMATCGEERLNTAKRHDKFVDRYLQTGENARSATLGKSISFNNPYLGLLLIPTSCRRPVGDGTYTDCTAGSYSLSNTKLLSLSFLTFVNLSFCSLSTSFLISSIGISISSFSLIKSVIPTINLSLFSTFLNFYHIF